MADTVADTRRLFSKPQNLNDAYGPPSNFLEIDVSNPETTWVGRTKYTTYEVRLKSGRTPSGSERTMPAHVSTGRVRGQDLHPVQNPTSLKRRTWPGPTRLFNPKLSSLFTNVSITTPPLQNDTVRFLQFKSDPYCRMFSLSNWSKECSTHNCG
uniref:Sorting nexin 3 n=1 Tax=Gasterosteus aculeatus aculeatus TaxID=481459 RepID=G3P2G3_GASAC